MKKYLVIFSFLTLAVSGVFLISQTDAHAQQLKPTQAQAQVPTTYNELFTMQWGGGSLYHLKARLATMGCMLNTIWVYDNNQWHGYNQYDVPQHLNQQFLNKFKDNIPPTSIIQGSCIDICSFDIDVDNVLKAGNCKNWQDDIQQGWVQYITETTDTSGGNELEILEDDICTDNFTPIVKQKVFERLPLMPDVCVIRQWYINADYTNPRFVGGGAYTGYILLIQEPLSFFEGSPKLQEKIRISALHTEVHELCHIQQNYYVVQQAPLNQYIPVNDKAYRTEAMKEFMQLTGFTENPKWNFTLPENSKYREIYSTNPIELSAELCTFYLLDTLDLKSTKYGSNFNYDRYLTPEIVEWLETYMVLPRSNS